MQAQAEIQQSSAGLTLSARAALELRLSDAKSDLQRAIETRNSYTHRADEFRALAAEATNSTSRVRRNAECVKFRLRAAGMDIEIAEFRGRVALLESMLAGATPSPAPAVVSLAASADMDDTHNFVAVPA